MNIGPKMAFILRVYQMTDAENTEDEEHDREMVKAGLMSKREFWKRSATRDVARKIRQRDNQRLTVALEGREGARPPVGEYRDQIVGLFASPLFAIEHCLHLLVCTWFERRGTHRPRRLSFKQARTPV